MKKLLTYKIKFYGEEYEVAPIIEQYQNNGRLGISLIEIPTLESFAMLTVNLVNENADINEAYIDTNNLILAEEFILKNKLGKSAEYYGVSGMCYYPKYKFNFNKLNTVEDIQNYIHEKYE